MTQQQLAALVGVTYQQLQKYERGANRITASRLYRFAFALGVPVSSFFEGIAPEPPGQPVTPTAGDHTLTREMLNIARDVFAISDPHLRASLLKLIKAIAGTVRETR